MAGSKAIPKITKPLEPRIDFSDHAPLISGLLIGKDRAELRRKALSDALLKSCLYGVKIVDEQEGQGFTIFTLHIGGKEKRITFDDRGSGDIFDKAMDALRTYRVIEDKGGDSVPPPHKLSFVKDR